MNSSHLSVTFAHSHLTAVSRSDLFSHVAITSSRARHVSACWKTRELGVALVGMDLRWCMNQQAKLLGLQDRTVSNARWIFQWRTRSMSPELSSHWRCFLAARSQSLRQRQRQALTLCPANLPNRPTDEISFSSANSAHLSTKCLCTVGLQCL